MPKAPDLDKAARPAKRSCLRSRTNAAKLSRPDRTLSATSSFDGTEPAGAGDAAAGAAAPDPAGDKGAVPAQRGCDAWGDRAGKVVAGVSETASTEMMAPFGHTSMHRPHEVQRPSSIVAMLSPIEIASRLQTSRQIPQPVQRFSSM